MKILLLFATLTLFLSPALAQNAGSAANTYSALAKPVCGSERASWINDAVAQAKTAGVSETVLRQLSQASIDEKISGSDRSQTTLGMFFIDFSRKLTTDSRLQKGCKIIAQYQAVFEKSEETYGVPAPVVATI